MYDDNASLIVRGKSGAEVEFGNELLVSEQEDGLITAWKLYKAKTSDTKKFNDIFDDMTSNGYHMEALVTDIGFYGKNNSKKLDDNNKATIINVIDAFIRDTKAKQSFGLSK